MRTKNKPALKKWALKLRKLLLLLAHQFLLLLCPKIGLLKIAVCIAKTFATRKGF